MIEELKITRDDLIDWLDRPPSNNDIDLCDYLVNALDNRYKYIELKQRIDKAIEYINNHIEEIYDEEYEQNYRCDAISGDDLLEILKGGNND